MNFDNDGKAFKISSSSNRDFLVSVSAGKTIFPSFGINTNGLFVTDFMVDSNGAGAYKRQTDKRWVTTSLIKFIMENDVRFEDVKTQLQRTEIVNAPNSSTHNLIVDRQGNICVVEPGRRNIFTETHDSNWYIMTNFPLSDYDEIVPPSPSGSGSDRYVKALQMLATMSGPMTVEQGFEVLKSVMQDGPIWKTNLSLIYDATQHALFYCLDGNFAVSTKCEFGSPILLS
ncbi:MAG: linear amide C-N hydrolase [Anaerolineae bacterium]